MTREPFTQTEGAEAKTVPADDREQIVAALRPWLSGLIEDASPRYKKRVGREVAERIYDQTLGPLLIQRRANQREALLWGYREGRDDREAGIWDDNPRTPYEPGR